jgi:hypothetical protein
MRASTRYPHDAGPPSRGWPYTGGQRNGVFLAPASGFDLGVEIREVGEDRAERLVRQGRRLASAHRRPPQRMRQKPTRRSVRPTTMFLARRAIVPLRTARPLAERRAARKRTDVRDLLTAYYREQLRPATWGTGAERVNPHSQNRSGRPATAQQPSSLWKSVFCVPLERRRALVGHTLGHDQTYRSRHGWLLLGSPRSPNGGSQPLKSAPLYSRPIWRPMDTLLLPGAFRAVIDVLHSELAKQERSRRIHGLPLQALGTDAITISELGRVFESANRLRPRRLPASRTRLRS